MEGLAEHAWGEIPGAAAGGRLLVPGELMSRPSSEPRLVRFARELLYFLLTIEILFLISGVSVTLALLSDKVALLGDYDTGPSYDRPDRTAQVLLSSGVSLMVTSSVFLLTTILSLLGLRLWRPCLLLPHLACLTAGTGFCFYYIIEAVLVGFQEDLGMKLAALPGFVICLFLDLQLCSVIILLHLPRPLPPTSPSCMVLPSSCPHTSSCLELPSSCPHTSLHLDLPPEYSILDNQLPSYEDSVVQKELVLASSSQSEQRGVINPQQLDL